MKHPNGYGLSEDVKNVLHALSDLPEFEKQQVAILLITSCMHWSKIEDVAMLMVDISKGDAKEWIEQNKKNQDNRSCEFEL